MLVYSTQHEFLPVEYETYALGLAGFLIFTPFDLLFGQFIWCLLAKKQLEVKFLWCKRIIGVKNAI